MLLGSPPDMIHRVPLRETGSAAACGGLVQIVYLLYYTLPELSTEIFTFPKISLYKSGKYGIISFAAGIPAANGGVAQLGERTVRIRKVESSILFVSTKNHLSSAGGFSFSPYNHGNIPEIVIY